MTSGLAPGLARKVSKVLETRTESPDTLAALTTLSSFYEDNNPAARRHLRATIEKRGMDINHEYLRSAETVIQALDAVQRDLDGLTLGCQRANAAVSGARASTHGMLADTERIQREMAANQKRAQLVQSFMEQYQLTDAEVDALQAPEIGEAFFEALDRVRNIHTNCKALLRTHHQRAGLELMDSMSAYQETAYERLCRWVQGECRNLGDKDAPEVDPLLQRASQALRERPVLFKYCAMEVATVRHNALFQRFITALTRGGPGGMPRPIEMHAHDPRRFLGDMLAWVHQSLASERELLVALFGDDAGSGAQRRPSGEAADMPRTAALLDRVFESICRPLKVRIEQVLMATPPLLLCFRVSQLLGFYTSLVDRLLGSSSQLTQMLAACRQLASRVFQEQLKGFGDKLLRYPPQPSKDLSPPLQLLEAFQQLGEIVTSFEASFDEGQGNSGEAEFAPVLAAAVNPLLEAAHRSSEALSASAPTRVTDAASLDPAAQRIYLINCLAALEQVLGRQACCATRARQVADTLESHVAALVRSHAGAILGKSGLAEIVDRMRLYKDGKATDSAEMAADPALPLPKIAQAVRSFITLLSQPDSQPEFRSVQVPRARADAVARVASSLADAYELVYTCLTDPANGFADDAARAEATKHNPARVRTILGMVA